MGFKNIIFVICIMFFLNPGVSRGVQTDFDYGDLGKVPVFDDGRVKPLESFARLRLLTFYGKASSQKFHPMGWLAELLFDQNSAYERRVFNVNDPAVVESLELERREEHKYSFLELSKSLQIHSEVIRKLSLLKEEERSEIQTHLMDLYRNFLAYFELSRSFSPFFTEFKIDSKKVARILQLPWNQSLNFRALINRGGFEDLVRSAQMVSRSDMTTSETRELDNFVLKLKRVERDLQLESFRVIPPQWRTGIWISPSSLQRTGAGSPWSSEYMRSWISLHQAYMKRDVQGWKSVSHELWSQVQQEAKDWVAPWRLELEATYDCLNLFLLSLSLYIGSFLILTLSWLYWRVALTQLSRGLFLSGFLVHTIGIGMRILIMGRPPVATLYESILFVGFVFVLFNLLMEVRKRNTLGVLVGSLGGVVLQFIGMRYESAGDSMGLLTAVLNSNFWLSTHVVSITIGYGCCLVGGLLGHLDLISRMIKPNRVLVAEEINRNMLGVALVGLFFSILGTILGGIWADQSWGRFWGWDPKENGAVCIILWLLFLLHARQCKLVSKAGFAAGMVFTNIVVALAWFGVNLLSVGLHSYGFTKNIFVNLMLFCGSEGLFIGAATALLWLRKPNLVCRWVELSFQEGTDSQ